MADGASKVPLLNYFTRATFPLFLRTARDISCVFFHLFHRRLVSVFSAGCTHSAPRLLLRLKPPLGLPLPGQPDRSSRSQFVGVVGFLQEVSVFTSSLKFECHNLGTAIIWKRKLCWLFVFSFQTPNFK